MHNRRVDKVVFWWAVVAFSMAIATTASAATTDKIYRPFIGEYVGKAVSDAAGEVSKRDLRISIKAQKKGFSVQWMSVSYKRDGRAKLKTYTVNFRPAQRAGIYRSAMRRDLFGHDIPLDPMKGDPYAWATIRGATLSVYELHVLDTGGYEIQTYRRTLIPGGMRLVYSRIRNGEKLRDVTGQLQRVK